MQLKSLRDYLKEKGLVTQEREIADELEIDQIVHDSREAGPNTLFVAVRGTRLDGHLFIDKAVENGARAVLCEAVPVGADDRYPGTAFIRVRDAREALAEVASYRHGYPSRALRMVGVTGTNGKTTTSFLVHHMLNALGMRCGLLGTVSMDLGDEIVPSSMTTPDALELQRALREMVSHGCKGCAMEVSSHALDQQRVGGVGFDVGIFTNLSSEHLDYHGTLEGYLVAKKRLFDGLSRTAFAVYNADDPAGARMVADSEAKKVSYGQREDARIRVEVLANDLDGLQLRLDGRAARFRLVGLFNAYNLAAAYGTGLALGFDAAAVIESLQSAPPVPGRFEQFRVSANRTVVVDYAHTPDALENVLNTVRAVRPSGASIWCVFGCGGDRDRFKRPVMGSIAERLANEVIVTSDNPRSEDPQAILEEIRTGMQHPDRAKWIVDRREAIRTSARLSAPGDVILIAGKGHEAYQVVRDTTLPFDDRDEARKAFAESKVEPQ